MGSQCEYRHHRMDNMICGNSIDIKIKGKEASEVRADVYVESPKEGRCHIVRLWGQIRDCMERPVPYALLKLVKVVCTSAGTQYQGIAHTISDCDGFYQFDLCYCDGNECYKVLVSKAYTGPEQVLNIESGNCHACEEDGSACCSNGSEYAPCAPYKPISGPNVPNNQCGCDPRPVCVPPCQHNC